MVQNNELYNKEIVKNYIDEVLNTGNVERISDYVSDQYTEIYEGKRYVLGIEGAKQHIIGVRKTYPDIKLEVERQICEGEYVSTSYVMTGTQRGEWMGIKPTGKVIRVYGVNIDRVVDGKIVEHGGAANLLEPLINIDAVRINSK